MESLTTVLPLSLVVFVTVSLSAPFPHALNQTRDFNYTSSSYIQFFKGIESNVETPTSTHESTTEEVAVVRINTVEISPVDDLQELTTQPKLTSVAAQDELSEIMIVFPSCNVSVSEVGEILSNLARSVHIAAPLLIDIMATGQELRLETDTGTLARGGARFLNRLEPSFFDSLLPPTQVPSCAGSSSTTMLMSLSGVATQLDIIANNEVDQEKADHLHSSASSLQLAAWIVAQLQASINTFYEPEAICEKCRYPTFVILEALINAIFTQWDMRETVAILDSAKDEITCLLDRDRKCKQTRLPSVECGLNFSTLAEQLKILSDFLKAMINFEPVHERAVANGRALISGAPFSYLAELTPKAPLVLGSSRNCDVPLCLASSDQCCPLVFNYVRGTFCPPRC